MTIRQWPRVLKLRLVFEFLNNFLYWMFLIYLTPTIVAAFGAVAAGMILFSSKSLAIVGGFLCGGLSDMFGRRTMMLIGSLMRIAQFAVLFIAFLQSEPIIQATYIVASQFIGMFVRIFYDTASRAMVADTVEDPDERTRVFTVFYTAANIAVVFGPLVGGIYFLQAPLVVVGIATLISVVFVGAVFVFFKETLPKAQRTQKLSLRDQVSGYQSLLKQKVLLAFFGFIVLVSVMGDANFSVITPIYVVENLGEQISIWGLQFAPLAGIMALNGILCVTLTQPVNAYYTHLKLRPQTILIISLALQMVGFVCYSINPSLEMMVLAMVIYTFGEVSGIGHISTFTLAQAGSAHRAKALSLSDFVRSIGQAIAPLLLIAQSMIGFSAVYLVLAIIGFGAMYFVVRAYQLQADEMKVEELVWNVEK